MARTEAMKEAQRRYRAKQKTICFRLNKDRDRDIIEWLGRAGMLARIKDLIRKEIREEELKAIREDDV